MAQINYHKTPENFNRAIKVYQYIHENPGKTAYAVNRELELGDMIIYHILGANLFRIPEYFLCENEKGELFSYRYATRHLI